MNVHQLSELITSGTAPRLIDVRTPGEYESTHISGAYNVPVDTLPEHAQDIRSGAAQSYVLVCQSGQRARRADEILRKAGVTNVHVLEGGMAAWTEAAYPVIRGRPRLSLERQVRAVAGAIAAIGGILALTVDPWFTLLPIAIGSGLVFSGITGFCGMALLLARLPYNKGASCNVEQVVQTLIHAPQHHTQHSA